MPSDQLAPPLLPGPTAGWWVRVRHHLLRSFPGRLLVIGICLKLAMFALRQLTGSVTILEVVDTLGGLMVLVGILYFLPKLLARARRRLLWRVRRKLILSYIFIGVFPVLLVIAFFVLSGVLLFLNVGSYLVSTSLRNLTEEARFLAQTTVLEIQNGTGVEGAPAVLRRKEATLASRYRGASIALVPTGHPRAVGQPAVEPMRAGAWAHVDPPRVLPAWVIGGFAGPVGYRPRADAAPDTTDRPVVIRAAGLPAGARPGYAVIVDIPLNDQVAERLREETSVKLNTVRRLDGGERARTVRPGDLSKRDATAGSGKYRIPWLMVLEETDWATGHTSRSYAGLAVNIPDIYDRLSAAQGRVSGATLGSLFLGALLLIASLFLVIEGVALVMGLALARSITGSVHSLFAGTERVQRGDFSHRIEVKANDQLGELADSFNAMTGSIEDLLRQAAEKKRLEEELRIAREIQLSLLPRGHMVIPGLSFTALCVPAREVGGDYYDLFRLDEGRLGVLIADVSGKGTSAALYMAELKGLMLSLSQIHRSPRQLLIHANRIIRDNLDSRSFITATYAVLDVQARTMTYARAGHTPLIYRASNGTGEGTAQVLAPDGMVLGLQIDNNNLFDSLLVEATLPLNPGDLLMFFTDGISEAMNADSDCFGESRLGRIVGEHGDLPTDQLRERILREIDAFVDGAPQHDDMTLILLKVDSLARDTLPDLSGTVAA